MKSGYSWASTVAVLLIKRSAVWYGSAVHLSGRAKQQDRQPFDEATFHTCHSQDFIEQHDGLSVKIVVPDSVMIASANRSTFGAQPRHVRRIEVEPKLSSSASYQGRHARTAELEVHEKRTCSEPLGHIVGRPDMHWQAAQRHRSSRSNGHTGRTNAQSGHKTRTIGPRNALGYSSEIQRLWL
jgi:hypothetical protein